MSKKIDAQNIVITSAGYALVKYLYEHCASFDTGTHGNHLSLAIRKSSEDVMTYMIDRFDYKLNLIDSVICPMHTLVN